MAALRCTAKLLKAMKVTPVALPMPSPNRLGDWTANLIRISRIQLVLAVSEPTRLCLVLDAAPYAGIPERFAQQLSNVLRWIGVPERLAAAEMDSMQPLEIAATNSQSVLGSLKQYAIYAESCLYRDVARSAKELTQELSGMIVLKPEHIHFPLDRVREVFGLPPLDWRGRIRGFEITH